MKFKYLWHYLIVTDDQLSWKVLLGNNSTNIWVLKDYNDL